MVVTAAAPAGAPATGYPRCGAPGGGSLDLLVALTQGNRDGWDAPHILTLLAIAGDRSGLCGGAIGPRRTVGGAAALRVRAVCDGHDCHGSTTMAFRGSEPMLSVFMQRLLGWEPVLVAWVQMLPNLVYGAMVILVGRLADRVPCHVLVMSGLALYAGAFGATRGSMN